MKTKIHLVLVFFLATLLLIPGIAKAEFADFRPQLSLSPYSLQQPPVVYTYDRGYASFGIKVMGGFTLATVSYTIPNLDQASKDIIDDLKKSLMGLGGGIGFDSGGRFAFEINILYLQKGSKFKGRVDMGGGEWLDLDADMLINQVSVPVMLKIKFLEGTAPYILGGGEAAYILSSKMKYRVEDNYGNVDSGEEDLFEQEEDTMNRFDYGVVAGGGVELAMGTITVFIEVRYHAGLANLIKQTEGMEPGTKGRSTAIIGFAGLKF